MMYILVFIFYEEFSLYQWFASQLIHMAYTKIDERQLNNSSSTFLIYLTACPFICYIKELQDTPVLFSIHYYSLKVYLVFDNGIKLYLKSAMLLFLNSTLDGVHVRISCCSLSKRGKIYHFRWILCELYIHLQLKYIRNITYFVDNVCRLRYMYLFYDIRIKCLVFHLFFISDLRKGVCQCSIDMH